MVGFTQRRYERSLRRVENRLEKLRAKQELLRIKKEEKRLTPAQFARKKTVLDDRFRTLSARERTLRGALRQEKARAPKSRGTPAR